MSWIRNLSSGGRHFDHAWSTGVIGPYDFRSSLTGGVIHAAAREKPTLCVACTYDFVDVRDVADGLIAAAEKGKRAEGYILSYKSAHVIYRLIPDS